MRFIVCLHQINSLHLFCYCGSFFDAERRNTFDSGHRCITGKNSSLCRDVFETQPVAVRADTLYPLIPARS
jgi:hypothetical protein